MSKQELLVIGGPTASGKSAAAVEVSRRVDGEVISADSMQIYLGMDIGTAKPTAAEMGGIPHHMLSIIAPDVHFSAAEFKTRAAACVSDIAARGKMPVVCGGTGLYIDALTKPMRFSIEGNADVRAALDAFLAREGEQALWARLNEIDPETAARLNVNDVRRVSRAIEVYELTGTPMSAFTKADEQGEAPYRVHFFALNWPREVLIERIERRVDIMIKDGFVEEVARLSGKFDTARHALGYPEIAMVLRGEISLDEAATKIKIATRQYAKRQMTWLRRDARVKWIDAMDKTSGEIADEIVRNFYAATGN